MGIGSIIGGLGSLASGIFSSNAAGDAAQIQAQAAQHAADLQHQQYEETRSDLQPFVQAGYTGTNKLLGSLDNLTSAFNPTQQQLEQTPGYQFNLSQGLKAAQNSAAARGLGVSGAALKGATTYATGLADNTLQTQFNIDQANKNNAYNKLMGTAQLGENAAAKTGDIGSTLAQGQSNALLTGAQGQSSAAIAQGTAFNQLLGSLGNYYMQYNNANAMGGLYSGGGSSGSS